MTLSFRSSVRSSHLEFSSHAIENCRPVPTQGWGLLSRFPPLRYFPIFSAPPKCMLAIEYNVYIWQVSPQLSCGDSCQIWMRFKECNRYFCVIENFAYGEIDERSFSNPHPWLVETFIMSTLCIEENITHVLPSRCFLPKLSNICTTGEGTLELRRIGCTVESTC